MVLGSHLGVPCGLDLKSQSLVIESFSVGRVPWGKILAAAGSKSFMALVSRVTKETTCVEESIAGSGTRAEPLEAAAQSVATGISTVLLWACRCNLSLFSDVGPLETIAENKKEQKSAAKRASGAKSSPTAAKLGCAFSHSAERIVDELGLLYPENRGILRKNMASV